ncbi:hypothetical protein, partial [Roseovarius dicentrarchi]|uniref:hypothetical protein n=1 Tax=Roseovarius dicentrarchi TaxID=2250573 RepID=UPI00139668EF
GRSYDDIFAAGLSHRVVAKPTARQAYLAGLIYTPVAVDREGRVKVDNWTYGGPMTQDMLLPYHGTGKRILLGRNPDDLSQPALAFDEAGDLIAEGIAVVERGAYGSKSGIREAARLRKEARTKTAQADAANEYLSDTELRAAYSYLDIEDAEIAPEPARKVVGARFGAPLRDKIAAPSVENETVPEEFYRNFDAAMRAQRAKGDGVA